MTTVPVEGGPTSGPTVLRMLLGAQLRRLREGAGVSRESAGWEIRSSESKISRMELGRVGFKERDVADLLTLYGVTAPGDRDALLKLARDANSPGWWHRYSDVLPAWFQSYLGLEAATALIRTYEVQFVPGLLQTAAYAREVILLGHRGASAAELDRRVDLRMERQGLLRRANPPQLWAVLDEAVLRRPIGGAAVMREQLDALIEATAAPHVRLQIVPFTAGGHAAASGAFSILRFGDEDLPDIVYIEQLTSAIYLDKRDDLDYYAEAMERLCVEAAPPERTREMLARIRDELYPA
ncbi:helix-turn-helix transcriptional regulator [Micromonospora sp. WMMD1128]|uniref:helix-turn-helix domain-containing protein n=1 Tax=unclassified Micromonospora TaxID=2617518 RepID=UPI00248B29AF|nr:MULTISPECIES: helix-turn-helix transcriptional regulator [unclassified Micromonospora]WBB76867.1 helix-turn-helix transcriptional regulator [Micromonospora sp. WMMD1128]WFE35348.1 helix-turn-helix transcriptional regulator [Micromonospora sp. WMMD975]